MSADRLEIVQITHDLAKRRSLVLLAWPDDPEKRLSLPVPYGTALADVPREAEAALRALSAELAAIRIGPTTA